MNLEIVKEHIERADAHNARARVIISEYHHMMRRMAQERLGIGGSHLPTFTIPEWLLRAAKSV